LVEYPYIQNTGRLKLFLAKIPTMGVPDTITQNNLGIFGLKSTNDRPIVKILSFIGFLDAGNHPNEKYKEFKLKEKSRLIMASSLRSAYSELFKLYPDAYSQQSDTLRDFFTSKTESGEQVVNLQVATFKALSEFAEFGPAPPSGKHEGEKPVSSNHEGEREIVPAININLQIQLPESTDPKTYDAIFKAISEHLLKGSK